MIIITNNLLFLLVLCLKYSLEIKTKQMKKKKIKFFFGYFSLFFLEDRTQKEQNTY